MKNRINKDIYWGYFGQFLYLGVNILLLPFVLKLLPNIELGMWYTFTAIGGLANLLDFGFKNTITRNIAYGWGGAKDLPRFNQPIGEYQNEPNLILTNKVIKSARFFYFIIGIVVLALLASFGTLYIFYVGKESIAIRIILLPWIIYILAIFFNIFLGYWLPSLKGIGAIKESYKSMVFSKMINLVIAIAGLYMGYGLLAVSIAFFAGSASLRLFAAHYFKKYLGTSYNFFSKKIHYREFKQVIYIMWPNAFRQGAISIANYLSDKVIILLTSAFLGLAVSASLGLSIQILTLTATIGNVLFNIYLPKIIHLKVKKNNVQAYKKMKYSIAVQALIIFSGGITIILFGNFFLSIINSNTYLVSRINLLILLIFVYIFSFHQICSSYIIADNKIPMFGSYLLTGIATVLISFLLARFFPNQFNLTALLSIQLGMQIIYNAWKWPKYVANMNNQSIVTMYISSFTVLLFDIISMLKKVIKGGK
ncbi:O-unit flippase-like protein [Liberiplasma polymorphum]|uniref:O-unit flippase-like protein n=1 Tax=Liberiplasma polymorphum TaxID=3374570 RepID=UPI003773508A